MIHLAVTQTSIRCVWRPVAVRIVYSVIVLFLILIIVIDMIFVETKESHVKCVPVCVSLCFFHWNITPNHFICCQGIMDYKKTFCQAYVNH